MKRGKDDGKTNTTPDATGSENGKAVRVASAAVRRRRKKATCAVITVLVAVLIFAAWLYGRLSVGIAEGEARFYFFDVGQGDAAAVVTREARDFPGAREGVRSMRFVEAALKSAKSGSGWTKI